MITAKNLRAQAATALNEWDREYEFDLNVDGCRLTIADDGLNIHIEHISVPDNTRRAGYGTAMMSAVTAWADEREETLRLHASTEFGTDRHVLSTFYLDHGFWFTNRVGGMRRRPGGEEL